jgi:hypothetical protein
MAGGGPALLCLAISVPVATALFVVPGHTMSQAVIQASMSGVASLIVVYLTVRMNRWRRSLYETIELAPDAYFLSGLDARSPT